MITMYDIAEAFERIENELISSMMRNISKHIADEQREGIQYSQWQAEQIKALARYRQHNAAKYGTQFSDINAGLDTVIRQIYASARMSEELKILEAVKHGLISAPSDFFTTDNNKLDMLIESVANDFQKAEYAVLRRADDMYRQIIFNSQVYLNSGAGTLRQAIDMASKDFISAGINCIQYKDGRLVNISSYAEMALRTANQRAKFAAEGNERAAYGIHTVLISSHNGACPLCQKWQGRVYIDDVYSGGKPDGKYPLLSSAIAGGMFHPNCQNGLSTFIEGISSEPQPPTAETMKQQTELYNLQQQQRYNERQIRKYKRLSEYSLDDENRQKYSAKLKEWQKRQRNLIADNPDVLRRQYDRERNYGRVAYSNQLQYYRPVTRNDKNALSTQRKAITISAKHITTSVNGIYLSDSVHLKPKKLHMIDKSITEVLKLLSISDSSNKPQIIVIAQEEMQSNAIAAYNPIKNIMYISDMLGKEEMLEYQKQFACPKDMISTVLHEFIHWKDAEIYRQKHGEFTNKELYDAYIDYLNAKSKKQLDKLCGKSYNFYNISDYAKEMYNKEKFFEAYTEYRVKQLLEG